MSKMLEQAILDAEQLKEAAIKNAESALIEKYSDQIRTAVDTILEQDEMPVDLPIKEGGGCGCPGVCKCAEKEDIEIPLDSLLGEPVADEVVVDFEDGREDEEAALQEQLDEEIEIDLDELLGERKIPLEMEKLPKIFPKGKLKGVPMKDISDMMNAPEISPMDFKSAFADWWRDNVKDADSLAKALKDIHSLDDLEMQDKMGIDGAFLADFADKYGSPKGESDLDKQLEIDEEVLNDILEEDDMGMPEDAEEQEAAEKEGEGMAALATALSEGDAADAIAEALLDQVAEHLKVDFDPTPGGWSDWTHRDAAETQEAFLARTKDTEIAEDQKEYQDAYKALEGLPMLQENLNKLEKENQKYKEAILYLKDKLEETNLSNAILLYTNRTLGSDSLNERQKNKIVEAIAKAGSVNEAKTIFETLQSAIESSTTRRQPKSLSEAAKRKSSLYLPRREEKVDTSTVLKERMMRLAGIKE